MSVKAYAFVSARIGAMRSYLLDNAGIKSLIEAPTWDDVVALLRDSEYGRDLGKIRQPGMQDIEEVLIKSLLRDYKKIITSSRGEARKFIENLGHRFEVSTVKAVLLGKHLGMSAEEIRQEMLIPFGKITELRLSKMLETESLEELADSLRNTPYHAPMQKGLNFLKEEGTPFTLLALLDRHVYTEILKGIKGLPDRDRKDAKLLIGTEVDSKNLLLALRCQNLDEDKVEKLFIKPWYRIKENVLMSCLAGNLEPLSSKDFPYAKYVEPGVIAYRRTGSLTEIELGMKKLILSLNRGMFRGDRFHIGVLIGYLNLKENEIRNIIAILRGKKDNLSREEIRKLVILPGEA
jgi:V/A-type H+-transporting ATPase subunit C